MEDVNEKILPTVKKIVGIDPDDTDFDIDLIAAINTAIQICYQIGGLNQKDLKVSGSDDTWESIFPNCGIRQLAIEYVPQKVKQIFDPDDSGTVSNARDAIVKELEARISYLGDTGE